jgi:gliding motility-associated-like protein
LEGGEKPIIPAFVFGTNLAYRWTPATYLSSDTARRPITKPLDDITYELFLTGIGGCTVSDDIFVKLLKAPEVPNAFSPNGDGIHDVWLIKYLESYPGATIDVFNRYGQTVFTSVGYSRPWDGTSNGKALPVGTYYYVIDPKNGRKIITGSVTILR